MTPPVLMIVDDEVDFVETMIRRLYKRGFTVLPAFSGQEALDKLDSLNGGRVDVVILDVTMPGMDGLEALEIIKNRYSLIEVIMLTAHATIESAIEGMKRGAFDYLIKPCEIDLLIRKVEEARSKKHQHEAKLRQARIKHLGGVGDGQV